MADFRNVSTTTQLMVPISVVLIVVISLLTWQVQSRSSQILTEMAHRELEASASMYSDELKNYLSPAFYAAETMADSISSLLNADSSLPRSTFLTLLKGTLETNPDFLTAGCAFEANAFDSKDSEFMNTEGSDAKGRFLPYLMRNTPTILLEDVEDGEFYKIPKSTGKSFITNPYSYNLNGKLTNVVSISSMVDKNNKFQGVIFIDLAVQSLLDQLAQIKLYDTGFAGLLSEDGQIIYHKNQTYIGKNIQNAGYVTDSKAFQTAMSAQKTYYEEHVIDGVNTMFFYAPIAFDTGQTWVLYVSVPMDEVLEGARSLGTLTVIYGAIALLVVMIALFFLVRRSLIPLNIMVQVAEQVANNDLNFSVDLTKFSKETLALNNSLGKMLDALLKTLAQAEEMQKQAKEEADKALVATEEANIAKAQAEKAKSEGMHMAAARLETIVEFATKGTAELSVTANQSERNAQSQAVRMAETATAMEEMNSTVLEVAKNAGLTSEFTTNMRSKATQGAKIVHNSVSSIAVVQEQALKLKTDMQKLNEHSRSISQIMSVISDIADQTNLLALNAAIEAARAGEAGRGFAVVADEVRKLAEKTLASTSHVSQAVKGIESSMAVSMEQVDTAVKAIEQATEYTNQSGEALQEIVQMANSAADQVHSIATASEEQSATSEVINQSILDVNTLAIQTAQAMQAANRTVNELTSQMKQLDQLIEELKNS